MKGYNLIKTKIGVGSTVTEKFGDMEENSREVRIKGTRNELLGCVQDVVGKNKSLYQL